MPRRLRPSRRPRRRRMRPPSRSKKFGGQLPGDPLSEKARAALDAAVQGDEVQTDTLFQGPPTRYRNVTMPDGFRDEDELRKVQAFDTLELPGLAAAWRPRH